MAFDQVAEFIDNLESSNIKHVAMLYEEPEYARQVQLRFLQNGLESGDCCVYAPPDDENLNLTRCGMLESGIDVERYEREGVLQFDKRIQSIEHSESKRRAIMAFMQSIKNTFFRAKNQVTGIPPRIRGVGSALPFVFAHENVDASASACELLVEKIWETIFVSFGGVWICTFQVHDILASMEEEWMAQLLAHHEAVIFLRKLGNGVAFEIKK